MLSDELQKTLISAAYKSINHGLNNNDTWSPDINDYPDELCKPRAVFITLKINSKLRGCIGTLEANDPLISNIAKYASRAAFHDPRFTPLTKKEFKEISLHISLLSIEKEIAFTDEASLVSQLRSGIDGLTIKKGMHKATFLPAVWEMITEPGLFLDQLKIKAGIKPEEIPDYAWKYQAESITDE